MKQPYQSDRYSYDYFAAVMTDQPDPLLAKFQIDDSMPRIRQRVVLAKLRRLDGQEFVVLDAHCPHCGGHRVLWNGKEFRCNERCELATPIIEFISEN